jgi:L-asparaginase
MRKKIRIIHTGGTLGMGRTPSGYGPIPGLLAKQMSAIPELQHPDLPAYHIHELHPLIDSSNMSPDHWMRIAHDIVQHHESVDGFIVLHGTDTMAYTASALPFILENLSKPVVLTGAQIPLVEIRNDARENLITAMQIAANYSIPEVMLFFGDRLLRGNRSVKVHADGFGAFASPNFPSLGTVGVDIDIRRELLLPMPDTSSSIAINALSESRVAILRLFPGISTEVITTSLSAPVKGVILESYGQGNAPDDNPRILSAIHKAVERGMVIVNCTQCLHGRVYMGAYATGAALAKAGVIGAGDMTTEATLAKLIYLFSQNLSSSKVNQLIQTNLKGELTPLPA